MVAYVCAGERVSCLLGLETPAPVWEPLYVRELTRVQWQPTPSGSPPEEITLDASFLSFRCLFITKRRVVRRCTVSSPCRALLTVLYHCRATIYPFSLSGAADLQRSIRPSSVPEGRCPADPRRQQSTQCSTNLSTLFPYGRRRPPYDVSIPLQPLASPYTLLRARAGVLKPTEATQVSGELRSLDSDWFLRTGFTGLSAMALRPPLEGTRYRLRNTAGRF